MPDPLGRMKVKIEQSFLMQELRTKRKMKRKMNQFEKAISKPEDFPPHIRVKLEKAYMPTYIDYLRSKSDYELIVHPESGKKGPNPLNE